MKKNICKCPVKVKLQFVELATNDDDDLLLFVFMLQNFQSKSF